MNLTKLILHVQLRLDEIRDERFDNGSPRSSVVPPALFFFGVCTLVCLMKSKDDESSQMKGEKEVDKCLSVSPDRTYRMVHMVIVA